MKKNERMKKTIAIVDDHTLIANALKGIVSNFKDFEVLFIANNGIDFQEKLKSNPLPDIVLLDINMPQMDGFETANWLKENRPQISIMVLSMNDDEHSLIKMFKNGAKGYMLKNANPTELEKGLEQIALNEFFVPDWATNKLVASFNKSTNNIKPTLNLSDREIEFLKYTATDLNYKEIADKMCCSPRTIENYRDSLCEKLEIKSRVGLAVYAHKNGYTV